MSRAAVSRGLALIGLTVQLAALLWPPVSPPALAGAAPLAGLLAWGWRPTPRWGAWLAAAMILYLPVAVMNLLAGPAGPVTSAALACGAVLAFFAGLDWTRRRGVSLR